MEETMSTPSPITRSSRNPNWAWIWLAYTGFLFLAPLLEPSLSLWLGTLVVFATFLGLFFLYVRACDAGRSFQYWMIPLTFLLGLVTFPWNPGASCLFTYAAAFIPFSVVSLRRVLSLFLLLALLVLGEGYYFTVRVPHGYFHVGWPNTFIGIFIMIIVGGGNIFFAQQRRAEKQLHAAQEENLALAAVAERERIARDLHDVLGHTLSVIVLKAELAGRLIERDPARAAAEIGDVERTARTALAEVREAIGGYRARGLAAEIEAARRTLDAAGVTLLTADGLGAPSMTAPSSWVGPALTPTEETVLALALREAVTNIVRHARATTCTLRFVSEAGQRRLLVEDNGPNYDSGELREGNGLRGMRERVESIGGQLSLQQGVERDRGTRLLISLPIAS
jgi:two-component system sensor histidine kinase DesK